MASNKTSNLGLDIWAETDYFKRAELNGNFTKIDSEITGKMGDISKQITEKLSNKADQSYVETMLATAVSGAPKGFYNTLTALQNAYPQGTAGVFLVLENGHIYIWNGMTWADAGVYQGIEVGPESINSEKIVKAGVSPKNLEGATVSKNILNEDTVTKGFYVKGSGGSGATDLGSIQPSANYAVSDWIPVTSGDKLTLTKVNTTNYAFYTFDKKYLSGDLNTGYTITAPTNARFLRVTILISNLGSNLCQIEKGEVQTPYSPYGQYTSKYLQVKEDNLLDGSVSNNKLGKNSVSIDKVSFADVSPNLFNPNKAVDGYIDYTTGTVKSSTTYKSSDYTKVESNQQYVRNYSNQLAFYDANKLYISGIPWQSDGTATFTTPANCVYIRCTVKDVTTFQLEKGSILSAFRPFGSFKLPNLEIGNTTPIVPKDEVQLFLPSEICIAVGRTIELYNSQVSWVGNIDNYHFKWECDIGFAMQRKWSCKGATANMGNHTLTCTVFDNNMQQVIQKSTTIKVVSNTINKNVNILYIGDSLSNKKPWIPELDTLSSGKIISAGTRSYVAENGKTYKHEGRSGFSAWSYLHEVAYSYEGEGVHPFWNPNTSSFDYNYYKTNTGVNPDIVQIYLGTNGMTLNPSPNADYIKQMVDLIRSSDASVPIYVAFTLYRGNQNGLGQQKSNDGYSAASGVWKLEEDRKVFNLMVKLNDLLKTYSNLYFIPISLTHDSEYNFGAVPTPVNPRAAQTEDLPVEATHPQTQGYLQMADIMFSTYAAHIG